jgi:hypothetical protein
VPLDASSTRALSASTHNIILSRTRTERFIVLEQAEEYVNDLEKSTSRVLSRSEVVEHFALHDQIDSKSLKVDLNILSMYAPPSKEPASRESIGHQDWPDSEWAGSILDYVDRLKIEPAWTRLTRRPGLS